MDTDALLAQVGELEEEVKALKDKYMLTLADMEKALELPWDKLSHLNSVCNAPQPVNLAMILAALEKK